IQERLGQMAVAKTSAALRMRSMDTAIDLDVGSPSGRKRGPLLSRDGCNLRVLAPSASKGNWIPQHRDVRLHLSNTIQLRKVNSNSSEFQTCPPLCSFTRNLHFQEGTLAHREQTRPAYLCGTLRDLL